MSRNTDENATQFGELISSNSGHFSTDCNTQLRLMILNVPIVSSVLRVLAHAMGD